MGPSVPSNCGTDCVTVTSPLCIIYCTIKSNNCCDNSQDLFVCCGCLFNQYNVSTRRITVAVYTDSFIHR